MKVKTIQELAPLLQRRELSAEELVRSYIENTQKIDTKLNSFVRLNERAMERARAIDKARLRGEALPRLAGIPIGIKDMICTRGIETTACSKILQGYVPPYSATLVERLEAAGAIIFGKNNQDEFAMGSSNENSAYGPV